MKNSNEGLEQSAERVRSLLVARGVEGAAAADIHTVATLAEKHLTDAARVARLLAVHKVNQAHRRCPGAK
jgi:hypothetical protein